MADERKAMLVRMSPRLMEELKGWATAELRSVNGLVEYLLTEAVRRRGRSMPEGPPRGGRDGRDEGDGEGSGGAASGPDGPGGAGVGPSQGAGG